MKYTSILFTLFIFISSIHGQNDKLSGYLVLTNNDTLHGWFENNSNYSFTDEVKIKLTSTGQILVVKADSMKYLFFDEKCFESIIFVNKGIPTAKNAQCVVDGYFKLYLVHEKSKKRYFILSQNGEISELYQTYEETLEGKRSNQEYTIILKNLMADNVIMFQKIDRAKLNIDDLKELVTEYNLTKSETDTKVYRYKAKTKYNTILYSGISNYLYDLTSEYKYRGGVICRISQPETWNRLSFNFGTFLNLGNYLDSNEELNIEFPAYLGYRIGKSRAFPSIYLGISPLLTSGINDYSFTGERYVFFEGGLILGVSYDFYLSKKIHIFADASLSSTFSSLSLGIGF